MKGTGEETYASIREASRLTGLSVPLLRRRIAAGVLTPYRTAADRRLVLLRLADVEAMREIEPVALAAIAA